MDELLAMLSKSSKTSDEERALESCPYTKKTQRIVSVKVDMEKFCKEKDLDYATVDKSVFPCEMEIVCSVMHPGDGDLSFGGKISFEDGKELWFTKTVDRIDVADSEKTREQTYADMLAEDTLVEKEARHVLHLLLREKRVIYAYLYYFNELRIDNTYNLRFSACAESKYVNTLRVNGKTLVSVIASLFDEMAVVVETHKLITRKTEENREKHLTIARSFHINERKKVVEKKQKQEEQTRVQLDDEAKKLAKEAADLKLMLGQKKSENAPNQDSI